MTGPGRGARRDRAGRPALGDVTGGRLLFGGDYNPEQWPEETWTEDLRLMKAAGVTSVTLGVFSWATIEPRPGAREFGWLDRLMDRLHEESVGVLLATPTASPPPWMGHRHPETLPRTEDGRIVWYGSRQQFCPSSPVYRRYAAAITEALAARYAGHPALRMWHINNEYCTHCWCDVTGAHFRRWLKDRYGTLDALNSAWGTAFWSQRYDDWAEILPPRSAQYTRNPAQLLDFRRFTSDALLECYLAERDIVVRHTPAIPVTTNFMPLWAGQDGWRWAEREDVVSVDVYPDPADPRGGRHQALVADLTRSQAGGGPWMLMEQAAGAVDWRPVNRPKPPGLNRLWSWQAVARGADALHYFQWRQSRQGAEKYHSAMLGHAGEHGRGFAEIKRIGAELARVGGEIAGTRVPAGVAVLHDWDSWWASGTEGRPSAAVDYPELLARWHGALWEAGLTADFARPGEPLAEYRLVLVPQLQLLTDRAVAELTAFVRGGGHLVCGFFSGVVDGEDRVRPGGMDARLRALLGIAALHEWWPLEPGTAVRCAAAGEARAGEAGAGDASAGAGGPFGAARWEGELWSEELEAAADAETVAVYADGELAGLPAVLRNGRAWYLSTLPRPDALRALLAGVAAAAGLRPVLPGLPEGVEAVRRGELLFLLNHTTAPVTVAPPPGGHRELLTGGTVTGRLRLDRYGVAILRPLAAPGPTRRPGPGAGAGEGDGDGEAPSRPGGGR